MAVSMASFGFIERIDQNIYIITISIVLRLAQGMVKIYNILIFIL